MSTKKTWKRSKSLIREIPQYVYSKDESKWVEYDRKPSEEEEEGEEGEGEGLDSPPRKFRIAQLNVLFDERFGNVYKPNVCFAEERFRKQLEIYESLDPNMINNNEVTRGYIDFIKSSPWIQDHFYLSNIEGYGDIMGNLLMSRTPFDRLFSVRLPKRRIESHVGVIDNTVFCCSHLAAYTNNGEKRGRQLQHLYHLFDKHDSFRGKNVLIFGDLNFHSEKENTNIREDYIDVWRYLHPDNYTKGFTFCARKNLMLKEMWPCGGYFGIGIDSAGIQMRLDRWLLKIREEDKNRVKFGEMRIIADELVYKEEEKKKKKEKDDTNLKPRKSNLFTDFVSMSVDFLFEKNIWRKKEDFLFPSDHFGLFLDFEI